MPAPSVKVLDFGIARLRGGGSRTRTGVQMGTFIYMAPEQATGASRSVGPWTDVFALGVLLVEMLTGVSEPVEETAWWTVSIRGESEVNPLLDALLPSSPPAAPAGRCCDAASAATAPTASPTPRPCSPSFRETCAPATRQHAPAAHRRSDGADGRRRLRRTPVVAAPIARPPRRVLFGVAGLVGAVVVVALVVALRPPPGIHRATPPVTVVRAPAPRAVARCPDGMVFIAGATLTTGLPTRSARPPTRRPRRWWSGRSASIARR